MSRILDSFSPVLLLVLTGPEMVLQRRGRDSVLTLPVKPAPPAVRQPLPSKARMPDGSPVPEEIREGYLTRADVDPNPPPLPALRQGRVTQFDALQKSIREGFRELGRRWISPIVVTTFRMEDPTQARALIDAIEKLPARRIFLTDYTMCCAIGLGLGVNDKPVQSVLAIERDWFKVGIIRYADVMVQRSGDEGPLTWAHELRWRLREQHNLRVEVDEMLDLVRARGLRLSGNVQGQSAESTAKEPRRASVSLTEADAEEAFRPGLERITRAIVDAWDDLTDEQWQSAQHEGITLCGEGAAVPGLADALATRLGVKVAVPQSDVHPALKGLWVYGEHLHEWRTAITVEEGP